MSDDLISRAAAIETVRKAKSIGQAHRMLVQLPSATDTNVGSNLIDRQAALDAIKKLEKPAPTAQHLSAIFDCEDTIKALPSAQLAQDLPNGCTDTISRQAALDAVFNNAEHPDKAYQAIRHLPSAQPGWIPVTERLPKKDDDYLVTTHSGQIARYIFIGGSSEEYWRRCATAWMPLPKPWEGGQDGKN